MTPRGLYVATVAQTGAWGDLQIHEKIEKKAHNMLHYAPNKRAGGLLLHAGSLLQRASRKAPSFAKEPLGRAGAWADAQGRAFHDRADEGLRAHRARLRERDQARATQEYI